jgi:hypothetical protein
LNGFELIPEIAQPLQSIIDIEKSGLAMHRIISDPTKTMESKIAEIRQVFRSVQLSGTTRRGKFSSCAFLLNHGC